VCTADWADDRVRDHKSRTIFAAGLLEGPFSETSQWVVEFSGASNHNCLTIGDCGSDRLQGRVATALNNSCGGSGNSRSTGRCGLAFFQRDSY
jgi:hypothetical protein